MTLIQVLLDLQIVVTCGPVQKSPQKSKPSKHLPSCPLHFPLLLGLIHRRSPLLPSTLASLSQSHPINEKSTMNSFSLLLLFSLFLLSVAAVRQYPFGAGDDFGFPDPGFDIPGFGSGTGGGYGFGYGGPTGGRYKSGVVPTSVVCKDKGPCYKKKVTCPQRCFTSFAGAGKGYGYGGGGGGCNIDCKKSCTASC